MRGFGSDLRFAARRLTAAPLFTLFAVVSLAVGVGVTTAVYSIIDAVLLRDLGIREPHRVAFVVKGNSGGARVASLSASDFDDLLAAQHCFANVAASLDIYPTLTSPISTEAVLGEAVSARYFATLGVEAAIGRLIHEVDERRAAPVAVISHRLWQTRFASDPKTVGKAIRLSGRMFDVIGVAGDRFEGPTGWFRSIAVSELR